MIEVCNRMDGRMVVKEEEDNVDKASKLLSRHQSARTKGGGEREGAKLSEEVCCGMLLLLLPGVVIPRLGGVVPRRQISICTLLLRRTVRSATGK